MKYLNISTESSKTESSSVDIADKKSAESLAKQDAKKMLDALNRIAKTSNRGVSVTIKNHSFAEGSEETLYNAMYKDYYKGDEHALKFELGRSSTVLVANKEKPIPVEIEITPQNVQSVVDLLNKTATRPRVGSDKDQINEGMLGELVSGLKEIAGNGKSNLARL